VSKRPISRAPVNVNTKHRIVAYVISDETATREWLEELGLIATDDEQTIWILTAAGEAAVARLRQRGDREAAGPPLH
jgi:hypothetical protein